MEGFIIDVHFNHVPRSVGSENDKPFHPFMIWGFRVWGEGLGFELWDLGFKVCGLGLRVWDLECRVKG